MKTAILQPAVPFRLFDVHFRRAKRTFDIALQITEQFCLTGWEFRRSSNCHNYIDVNHEFNFQAYHDIVTLQWHCSENKTIINVNQLYV